MKWIKRIMVLMIGVSLLSLHGNVDGAKRGLRKKSYNRSAVKRGMPSTQRSLRSATGEEIVTYANQFLGTPYKFGTSNGNTFDCSGFVKYVYKHFGVNLPGGSYNQVNQGISVHKEQLEKGDLLFFSVRGGRIDHVGIYAGNNQVLHTYNQYGVKYDDLDKRWLKVSYVTAKRVLR